MKNTLKKIGLNEKEIKVYLTLLEYGARPASFIAQKSFLNRATTYNILQELTQKNIVHQTIRADIKQFEAIDPEKLQDYLQNKANKILSLQSDIEEIIPELESLRGNALNFRPKFKFFEGRKGMQELHKMTRNCQSKQIYCIASLTDMYAALSREWCNKEFPRRWEKDIWIKVIRSDKKEEATDLNQWPGEEIQKRELRHLPPSIEQPDMSFYIWDEKYCAYFSSKKENYGLLIESPEFYQTQKVMWDSLWDLSK